MEETKKTQSPMAWVLGQTGDHGGQYILSVVLAIIGVAFSLAPYFVVIGVVQGLMDGVKDFSFYLSRCLIMAMTPSSARAAPASPAGRSSAFRLPAP